MIKFLVHPLYEFLCPPEQNAGFHYLVIVFRIEAAAKSGFSGEHLRGPGLPMCDDFLTFRMGRLAGRYLLIDSDRRKTRGHKQQRGFCCFWLEMRSWFGERRP